MNVFQRVGFLLRISHAQVIARRYFVTNGFDGALTMLGLTTGFYVSGTTSLPVTINACLGTAIALGMSGVSSAYISESAERKKELRELEQALARDLENSDYGTAAHFIPFVVGFVNGVSPLVICVLIIAPLWLAQLGVRLPFEPLDMSIAMAFFSIFALGVFLGRISGASWLWMGLKSMLIGLFTALFIFLLRQ